MSLRPDLCDKHLENVCIDLDLFLLLPGIGLLIHQLRYFLILNHLLANLMRSRNVEFYLMGDFNRNLASPQPDISTVLLTNIVDIYNLHQLIDSPTRISDTSSTLTDVIFTNCQNNIVSVGVSHVSPSDQSLVYAFRKMSINSPKGHSTLTYRKFNNFDSARFRCDISTQDWDRVNSYDDPNVMWDIWKNLFLQCVDCVQNGFGHLNHPGSHLS